MIKGHFRDDQDLEEACTACNCCQKRYCPVHAVHKHEQGTRGPGG